MSPELVGAFEKAYGSVEEFQDYFVHAGEEIVGSGWVWLLKTPAGRLKISTTANHENPLMDTCDVPGLPILACDLWEHAYSARKNRVEFLRNFLSIVNWSKVHSLYDNGSKTDPFVLASH